MRRATLLVMLALLLGAGPAPAQDSPGIIPTVQQRYASPAKKPVKRKAAAAKAKPAQTKSAQTKPAKSKAVKTKPAKTKPAETETAETKPAEAKSAEAKPAEAKPIRLSRVARKHAAAQAAAAKAAAAKSVADKAAAAKKAAAKPAAPQPVDIKAEPAPAVAAVIPQGERQRIQAALLWAGDYSDAAGGDDPMLAAIKNFQKRHKAKVTGVLTPSERTDLLTAAKVHEDEYGWSVVVDPATGIRIGLPGKLVPQAREAAHGTRWSSAHGEVQVETFRIKEPGLTLAALFEREKKTPSTRRVENSALHDDGFFLSGQQGLKRFSVRAKLRDGEARGVTLLYDQMMETIVEPVMGAMAAAFSPFPGHSAPYAALAKSVEYGNGLVVSTQGHVVTDLKLTQGCQVIVASGFGDADRLAEDSDNGLALLRVYGPRQMSPLALARDTPKSSAKPVELTLIGIPDPKEQDGGRNLTEIKARLADGGAIELRQPVPMAGFTGAAALGAQGQFLGMMEIGQAVLASVAAAAPPVRLVSAETIRGFLAAQQVENAPALSGDAAASVVRIICVRK